MPSDFSIVLSRHCHLDEGKVTPRHDYSPSQQGPLQVVAKVLPRMILNAESSSRSEILITRNSKISANHFDMQDVGKQIVVGKLRESAAVSS